MINNKQNLMFIRKFNDRKLPTVIWNGNYLNSTEKIGVKSELKQDNPDWKATKGNGKSIYDCENELWCEPKEGEILVTSYKKKYLDKYSTDEWIEPNLRQD
tara:strand:+ start:691 stop:993 length:303 start_codon:yes stop_codon:yes gene_type:complete